MAVSEGYVKAIDGAFMWDIEDQDKKPLIKFKHKTFPDLLDGVLVYFVNDIPPIQVAENVQLKVLVDKLVATGIPKQGATVDAQRILFDYVLKKLLINTYEQNAGRPSIVPPIETQMAYLANEINLKYGGRATVHILRTLGL